MPILVFRRKQNKKWKVPDQRSEESKRRKFPIKDWKKAKEENSQSKIERKQKKKIPNQRLRENKRRKKIPDQTSEENKRNMQKGLWIRQYLNITELSPPNKERKETTTWSGPLPLIVNQNPVR